MNRYQQALEAAGAIVILFKTFGSYQGDWYALVTFEGKTGWVHGYFGSCTHCDAFEGEFGYSNDRCDDYYMDDHPSNCPECFKIKAELQPRLANFGKRYLDDILTPTEAIAKAAENESWDLDAGPMTQWLKENSPQLN